jgi:uncharacterized protein YbaA (DUF1428 family)
MMKTEMKGLNKSEPSAVGNYAQVFVYRVPKNNHDKMVRLEAQILARWEKHGILLSEFYQQTNAELVKGFTNIGETISAGQDEEVWVEIQHYRNKDHRDEIFAAIRKDMDMLQLFGQWYGLVTQGINSVMGDFNKLKI